MKLVITMSRRLEQERVLLPQSFLKDWVFRYTIKPISRKRSTIMNMNLRQKQPQTGRKALYILGRCASDILKDRMNVLNIFVCADKEDRILRIMQKDHLDHDSAREKVEKTDEERAAYYYEHTGKTWGDVNDYHMILDTSELGVENCADILMHYFEKLEYI